MRSTFTVTYHITCRPGEDPEEKARGIALEQSAELPSRCIPPELGVVPEILRLEPRADSRHELDLAFPEAITGLESTQLLNNLFGNISLKSGIRLVNVEWTPALLKALGGPGHGIDGVRRLCGVPRRTLTCSALKPLGLTTAALAAHCKAFTLGGIDLIKDDHGLADQATSPFQERLIACQNTVEEINAATGRGTLYLPNVTAPRGKLEQRAEAAREAGCRAVLVNPFIVGLDVLQWLRDQIGLAVMAHPAFAGAVAGLDHGIDPALMLGELPRLLGADMVVYTNAGGRFPTYDQALCNAINHRLRRPLPGIAPAFPTPGGGVDAQRVGDWVERYGPDTILLIGGSLYAQGDVEAASRRFLEAVDVEA